MTPVDVQESQDNVQYVNFGREQDPAQFLSSAEKSIETATRSDELIDLDEPAQVFALPEQEAEVIELAPKELTRAEQLHLAVKSMSSTDQVAYISAISRSLPSLRDAGVVMGAVVEQPSENWFKKLLVGGAKPAVTTLSQRELIEREAVVGGTLFDAIPAGHRREFFCLDDHTWVWHEEWVDENDQRQVTSTRYEVHTSGILKAQNAAVYKFIDGPELENLVVATRLYYEKVAQTIYNIDPTTGQTITRSAA